MLLSCHTVWGKVVVSTPFLQVCFAVLPFHLQLKQHRCLRFCSWCQYILHDLHNCQHWAIPSWENVIFGKEYVWTSPTPNRSPQISLLSNLLRWSRIINLTSSSPLVRVATPPSLSALISHTTEVWHTSLRFAGSMSSNRITRNICWTSGGPITAPTDP